MIQIGDSVEINMLNESKAQGKIIRLDSDFITVMRSNLEIQIPWNNVTSVIKTHINGD
jgi:hypothetical protein